PGGVALDGLLQGRAHATRILESRVDAVGLRLRIRRVRPGCLVVFRLARIEAGEQAVVELELLSDEVGTVRVNLDVVLVVALVLDRVSDDAQQERDVRSGADGRVEIRRRGRAGEARVDGDELGAARLLRLH